MNIHFSSKTNEWATPQDFFDELNKEFNFNLDPCATKENAKCKKYFTQDMGMYGGLGQSWDNYNVFCNPPYGREIGKWVKKASEAQGGVVVMLIPARTDTKYFHEYVYQKPNVEIRFLKGRLKFGGCKNSAPFPSMIVIFGQQKLSTPPDLHKATTGAIFIMSRLINIINMKKLICKVFGHKFVKWWKQELFLLGHSRCRRCNYQIKLKY